MGRDMKIKPRRRFDSDSRILRSGYLESDNDFIENNFDAAVLLVENADKISKALKELLMICNSRGAKLGLDEGGPVLDKARAALELFGIKA